MQKQVSKHGISILALSILLILSLGLTATFAVFNTSGTATGTVSFSDTIQITSTQDKTINVSIDIGGGTVTFASGANQLGSATVYAGGATFFWKATLAITAGSDFFTFDTSDLPQLNSTNAAAGSSTNTLITWVGASGVTSQQTLDIENMLEDLAVVLDTEEIGGYNGTPTGTLTLTIMAQYNAFA